MEIWKEIEETEGNYQVSSLGRVKSLARIIISKIGISMKVPETILSNNSRDKDGYVLVSLKIKGHLKLKTRKAHRLVAQAFLINLENKPMINHKNGIKHDNRLENLEWCTASENQRHSIDILNKRILRGTEIGNSKLTPDLVKELKYMKEFFSYTKLQEIYGVSRSTIHLAVTGKNWKHLNEE